MSLKDDIIARIHADGPMRIDEYMSTCLLHPTKGYYTTRPPFGAEGDFTTAPEISQMFGELIGLSIAQSWLDQGAPAPFTLAELGPGRGTLMADVLRVCKAVPGFWDAVEIVLVEASPALQLVQQETLNGHNIQHFLSTDVLPDQPLFLIANEFFDALPIRQFVRAGSAWRERQVGLEAGVLYVGLGPELPQPALHGRLEDTKEGDLVETASGFAPAIEPISKRIAQHGGAALIIDYGDWRTLGDTLQAVQAHKPVDPLASPGLSDLTAHVDFEALSAAATSCAFSRVTPQGVFLERLGITARAQKLAEHLNGDALGSHVAAHRRLTHPDEMGNLFKVIGLYPPTAAPPPGLEP
jgi:SAM-dependent MidA family methyltransferase